MSQLVTNERHRVTLGHADLNSNHSLTSTAILNATQVKKKRSSAETAVRSLPVDHVPGRRFRAL